MKIFYICYEDLSDQAAPTTHVKEIVENLYRLGNDVVLFAPKIGKLVSKLPLTIVYVPVIRTKLIGEYLYYALLFFYLIIYQIRIKADTFYVREMGTCLAVTLVAKLFGIAQAVEVNGNVLEQRIMAGISHKKYRLFKLFQKLNFKFCDKIIVVSEQLKNYAINYHNISNDKIKVVENGVNTELFKPLEKNAVRGKLGLDPDKYYLTYVGGFYPHHKLESLIKLLPPIMDELSNCQVLLVGDGYHKNTIKSLVEQLNLEHYVRFVGKVKYENIPKWINASDACILFFSNSDGQRALKLLEYLSCGVPVIVNFKSTCKKLLEKKVGLQLDLNYPIDSSKRIIEFLKNESYREELGKCGRGLVIKNLTWRNTAVKIMKVCKDMTG